MVNRENKPSPVARESSVYSTIYKRAGIKGWWVGWYESGNRKAKALPSKELSEHFKHIKYTQLNSDVFSNQIELIELREEEKLVRSLNDVDIKKLLKATEQYTAMKIRVLLALATGLRRGDIDSLS